jgi:hypothetical protein
MVIVGKSGVPSAAEVYAATVNCRHEDLFPVSPHENQLQLSIHYQVRAQAGDVYSYSGASQEPLAVAYNLFSLRADHVVYNAKEKTLEARGSITVEDESGRHSGEAMTFKVENGRATQLR